MRVIAENLITELSASNSDSNYPSSNLLNEYPGMLWKGLYDEETLTITLAGLTSGFALFNTNADDISVQITDPNEIEWESGVLSSGDDGVEWETGVLSSGDDGVAWSSFIVPFNEIATFSDETNAFMIEWAEVLATLTLTIVLSNSLNEIIYAGVAIGGLIREFSGPHGNLTESTKDLSYVDEYNTGSVFVKDRDVLRVFDMEHIIDRDSAFQSFIFNVKKIIKKRPAAWLITDLNDSRWLVYARFTREPSGSHSFEAPGYTKLSYQLTEVR